MIGSNCIRHGTFERRAKGCDCPLNIHAVCPYTKACSNIDWYISQLLLKIKDLKGE